MDKSGHALLPLAHRYTGVASLERYCRDWLKYTGVFNSFQQGPPRHTNSVHGSDFKFKCVHSSFENLESSKPLLILRG